MVAHPNSTRSLLLMLREGSGGLSARSFDPYGYSDEDNDEDNDTTENADFTANPARFDQSSQGSSRMKSKYGIGAKLLLKMGYVEGQGLGRDGSGIAAPIQATQRPMPSVGLGMATSVGDRSIDAYESSDDEEPAFQSHDVVTFKKSATETLPDKDENQGNRAQTQLNRLLSNLQTRLKLKIPSGLVEGIPIAQFDQKIELERIASTLLSGQERITNIDERVGLLEAELMELDDELTQLKDTAEALENKDEKTLSENAACILSLSDISLVDSLLSDMLQREYASQDNIVVGSDHTIKDIEQLIELVETLRYQMDTSPTQLNKTQSTIYMLVFNGFLRQWEDFTLDREQISRMVSMLLDYEPLLKFINCYDYVMEVCIYPKLLDALAGWDITRSDKLPPRLWLFDFLVFIDEQTRIKLEELVANKLAEYCDSWYHRDSPLIPKGDLIFMQELLGTRYHEVIKTQFLPRFIAQLWEKHFDPLAELEDCGLASNEEGSIYYAKMLNKYKNYFNSEVYGTLINAMFNDYNKILFQWLMYSEVEDKQKARDWFCWQINEMFQDSPPIETELKEIRRTLAFLNEDAHRPIHDDRLDLAQWLNKDSEGTANAGEAGAYNVQNIPMRKVAATFKDVVEDFCAENGFILKKLPGQYTQLPYGHHKDTLAPMFEICSDNSTHVIAMKDDILWVKNEKDNFVPKYLYELK